jgi:hypothetical protein
MKNDGVIGVLSVFLLWTPACAQSGSESFPFRQEICGPETRFEPVITSDIEIFVDLIGVANTSQINAQRLQIRRALGLGRACAIPQAQGFATIAYDPVWAAGDTPCFYLALGHEAGHHFCGHFTGNGSGRWAQSELEADQFAGASIKRFEVHHNRRYFDQVFVVAAAKYPDQGSALYPSRAARLAALKRGYEEGSPCGNLAPVAGPGYAPPRSSGPPRPCRPVQTGPTSYACQ